VSRVHCREACDTVTALRLPDQIGYRTMQVDEEDSDDVKAWEWDQGSPSHQSYGLLEPTCSRVPSGSAIAP
jgi:hypothetical protein